MRILGLDVGSKTIGVACSDALLITAQGVETIKRSNKKNDMARLGELIKEKEVHEIVIGMPKHMNGSKGENAEKVEAFGVQLQEVFPEMRITYWDERLSTAMARRSLIEGNMRRDKRKEVIDKMAAVVILQGYLDFKS